MMKISKTLTLTTIASAMIGMAASAGVAQGAEIIVSPSDPSWASGGNSGGGSSAITTTAPRSGNGSLEMTGDRTRYGRLIDGLPLSTVTDFGFDWMVAPDSVSGLSPDYTPALRMHFNDGSELIWEGAYNGVSSITKGSWYTEDITGDDQVLWQWTGSTVNQTCGAGNALCLHTVTDWADEYEQAAISAISVGVGSSVGSDYHAFSDNVVLGINEDVATFNFETAQVPEPATLGLMGIGLAGIGFAARRRRQSA